MKPVYVLGTGLSHNGSAVLLKDGKVCAGIEKERITRKKHDGGNDTDAIQYCLDAAGISPEDLSVIVQCANFEIPPREKFHGKRLLADYPQVPLVSISHHLAHAYSAAGTCDFDECNIMVIDGCGSPLEQCTDLTSDQKKLYEKRFPQKMICEKDTFYHFDGQKVTTLFKDFSEMADDQHTAAGMQTTKHSIGGFYAAISRYVFGNLDDVGKLMGLAPYGKPGFTDEEAFVFAGDSLTVKEEWKKLLEKPSSGYEMFKSGFQYYADIAFWAQQQVEKAVKECFEKRLSRFPAKNVAYSGGVALNAVANARLLNEGVVHDLYIEPAAGDNGLALGCAYYGWLEFLDKSKASHDGNTCFGRSYSEDEIQEALAAFPGLAAEKLNDDALSGRTAEALNEGKIAGWFQSGSEFGPRALGHRSIIAHPGFTGLGDKINAKVKFREDFRPFAPAVLPRYAAEYFVSGRKSPYMILVDKTKEEHKDKLRNVTHVNGTARVQTVEASWNLKFTALLEAFHRVSGIPVLLNTSFNKKGMPMVETPSQAIELFLESEMDLLVLENFFILKSR